MINTKFMIFNGEKYNWCDKNNTRWIHGFLALCIFVGHFVNYLGLFAGTTLGSILASSLTIFVGLFFFFSGYGLYTSYKSIGGGYIKSFTKRRFLPFYINYVILILFYLIVSLLLGNSFDFITFIKSFFIGGSYVSNGWYIQTLLLFYLFYLLVFILKISNRKKIILMTLLTILYWVIFYIFNLRGFWIVSIFLFPLGMIYSEFEDKIKSALIRKKVLFIILSIFITAVGGFLILIKSKIDVEAQPLLHNGLVTIGVTITSFGIVGLLHYINLNFGVFRILGKYSYEIYTLQGIAFMMSIFIFGFGNKLYFQIPLCFLIVALLCMPFHLISQKIYQLFRK